MSDDRTPRTDAEQSLVPPAGWLDRDVVDAAGPGVAWLVLLTFLALMIRLVRLDAMSLWVDEIFTWELVTPSVTGGFWSRILAAYQGPLYHAAVWPLVRISDSAFMLRLPSAVAGTMTVPLIGLLAAQLWSGRAGRIAMLLAAVSPFAVWYSIEARGYGFVIMFAAAGGLLLTRALKDGLGVGRALVLALVVFGGLASNFAFVPLLIAFGVTVLLVARPRTVSAWGLWCLALGGGVLLAVPWLLEAAGIWEVGRVVPGAATGPALRGDTTFSPWALPFTGYSLLYGFSLGPSLEELHAPDRLAAARGYAPILGVAMILAAVPLVRSLVGLSRQRWTLLLWTVIPLGIVSLLAVRNVKPFNVRYAATVWPWVLIFLAAGIDRLPRLWRWIFGLGVGALFIVSTVSLFVAPRYAKEDIRAAAREVQLSGLDQLPVLAPTVGPVVRYYWPDGADVRGCWDEPLLATPGAADTLVARQLRGVAEVVFVRARAWGIDPHGLLPDALARGGHMERVYAGPGVKVDHWRRSGADDPTGEGGGERR